MTNSISSSFNIDSMVSAMMMPIKAKITTIDKSINEYQVKLSDIGKLKSSISNLRKNMDNIEGNQSTTLPIDKLKSLVQEFVKIYNETKITTKNSHDFSLRKFNQNLRTELNPNLMNNIGLNFDKNGVIQFNEVKFDNISLNDSSTLNSTVNDMFDIVLASGSTINNMLSSNGKLNTTEDIYSQKISKLNNKKDVAENQAALSEVSYKRQFSALQKILNQLDSNQNVISNFISNLNSKN